MPKTKAPSAGVATVSVGGLEIGTGTLTVCVAPLPSVTVKTIVWLPDFATAASTLKR